MKDEVVSMCKAADNNLICGMINGIIGLIDVGSLRLVKIFEKAHSGTVISCIALKKLEFKIVVT